MDMDGFSVSKGSACSSGSVEPSPTLIALGLSIDEAREGVRISTGPETEFQEVELLAERLVNRLKEFILKKRSGR
jgi:cysteine desulfurase